MLNEKLNLKTIYFLLNIILVFIYYIKTDIQLIDVLYLILVLFFICKNIYVELFK